MIDKEPELKPRRMIERGDLPPERIPDEKELKTLGFTVRALDALERLGFEIVGDLRRATEGAFKSLGAPPQAMKEILKTMNEHGIEFRRESKEKR